MDSPTKRGKSEKECIEFGRMQTFEEREEGPEDDCVPEKMGGFNDR